MIARPIPAEWSPHRAMWVGWPSHGELWEDNLEPAQAEVEALVRALAGPGREQVRLMVGKPEALADARARFDDIDGVEIIDGRFGDIWLRDTGPIFAAGSARAAAFRFNGWGGKYELEHDDTVAAQIGAASGVLLDRHDFILEGGALDHDGSGTILTTRQCLLNPNRNPGWTETIAEQALADALGARKLLWLGDGLLNDHTDGHVDNLARFVAPGVLAVPRASGADDPNAAIYADAKARAEAFGLKVAEVPSPGRVESHGGRIEPASYMNFAITTHVVVVPTYGTAHDADGVAAVQALFPDRPVVGVLADAVLAGGGSFHCASQQMPRF